MSRTGEPPPVTSPVIGVARTPYLTSEQAPRQGFFASQTRARLVIYDDYLPALDGVERFSHLIVLFAFDRFSPEERSLSGRPPGSGLEVGAFACCTPRRPSGLGLDVCRLLRREGNTLHVAGVDMLDGSPLISIRPYIARVHSFPGATGGYRSLNARQPVRPKDPDGW